MYYDSLARRLSIITEEDNAKRVALIASIDEALKIEDRRKNMLLDTQFRNVEYDLKQLSNDRHDFIDLLSAVCQHIAKKVVDPSLSTTVDEIRSYFSEGFVQLHAHIFDEADTVGELFANLHATNAFDVLPRKHWDALSEQLPDRHYSFHLISRTFLINLLKYLFAIGFNNLTCLPSKRITCPDFATIRFVLLNNIRSSKFRKQLALTNVMTATTLHTFLNRLEKQLQDWEDKYSKFQELDVQSMLDSIETQSIENSVTTATTVRDLSISDTVTAASIIPERNDQSSMSLAEHVLSLNSVPSNPSSLPCLNCGSKRHEWRHCRAYIKADLWNQLSYAEQHALIAARTQRRSRKSLSESSINPPTPPLSTIAESVDDSSDKQLEKADDSKMSELLTKNESIASDISEEQLTYLLSEISESTVRTELIHFKYLPHDDRDTDLDQGINLANIYVRMIFSYFHQKVRKRRRDYHNALSTMNDFTNDHPWLPYWFLSVSQNPVQSLWKPLNIGVTS